MGVTRIGGYAMVAHCTSDEQNGSSGYLPRGIEWALAASVALACWAGPAAAQHGQESNNMRLLGHHDLQARSAYWGVIQEQDGRWIAYVGHHNGSEFDPLSGVVEPNGNSILDVTNPRRPFL